MNNLLNKYLNKEEQNEFSSIVEPIYKSYEFQRRLTSEFPHHGKVTLGEHIIEVAILTYKKCKKKKDVDLKTSVYIAMMHDLYTIPWQNNEDGNVKKFINKHGFRHPIEAVINSINWFPLIYKENNSEVIIDGILHHMYPLPVRRYKLNTSLLELKNNNDIDDEYKNIILKSTRRGKILGTSFSRSKYKEGRIVSHCDKKVSFSQIKNINNLTSLVTGHNKNLLKK